jgi:hypothetical protein
MWAARLAWVVWMARDQAELELQNLSPQDALRKSTSAVGGVEAPLTFDCDWLIAALCALHLHDDSLERQPQGSSVVGSRLYISNLFHQAVKLVNFAFFHQHPYLTTPQRPSTTISVATRFFCSLNAEQRLGGTRAHEDGGR